METILQSVAQPLEISTKVAIEIDSKGQRKPSVEIRITSKLDGKTDGYDELQENLYISLQKAKEALKVAMKED